MALVRTDIKFTYAEYSTLPETGPRYQIIEGELTMSPSPNLRHQILLKRFFVALCNFIDPRSLGVVLCAPLDVILSLENVLQPDIVFISTHRRSILSREGIRGGPDLCVEILSSSSRDIDRNAKRLLYAKYGVTEYWIVDPEANTVELYRLQENATTPSRRLTASETLTSALIPGFSLALAEVFAP